MLSTIFNSDVRKKEDPMIKISFRPCVYLCIEKVKGPEIPPPPLHVSRFDATCIDRSILDYRITGNQT